MTTFWKLDRYRVCGRKCGREVCGVRLCCGVVVVLSGNQSINQIKINQGDQAGLAVWVVSDDRW